MKGTQKESNSRLKHLLVHPDVLGSSVLAFFRFERQTNTDADGNLVSFPKGFKVFCLDTGIEFIYHPQREKEKLPQSIRTYGGLDGRINVVYVSTT